MAGDSKITSLQALPDKQGTTHSVQLSLLLYFIFFFHRVCHGFRSMKQDDYFWGNFDHFLNEHRL